MRLQVGVYHTFTYYNENLSSEWLFCEVKIHYNWGLRMKSTHIFS